MYPACFATEHCKLSWVPVSLEPPSKESRIPLRHGNPAPFSLALGCVTPHPSQVRIVTSLTNTMAPARELASRMNRSDSFFSAHLKWVAFPVSSGSRFHKLLREEVLSPASSCRWEESLPCRHPNLEWVWAGCWGQDPSAKLGHDGSRTPPPPHFLLNPSASVKFSLRLNVPGAGEDQLHTAASLIQSLGSIWKGWRGDSMRKGGSLARTLRLCHRRYAQSSPGWGSQTWSFPLK